MTRIEIPLIVVGPPCFRNLADSCHPDCPHYLQSEQAMNNTANDLNMQHSDVIRELGAGNPRVHQAFVNQPEAKQANAQGNAPHCLKRQPPQQNP